MMSLLQITSAAHLGGSVVLALFFLLLARHDPRPWLREWTAAWVAQAIALAMFLGASWYGWPASLSLYLFLAAGHGLLLVSAAYTFAHGRPTLVGRVWVVVALLAWSWVAPRTVPEWLLDVVQLGFLAAASMAAATLLWQAREPGAIGVRLSTYVFTLVAVVRILEAGVLAMRGNGPEEVQLYFQAAPLLTLFLQMMLGLSLVLGVMERAQWTLAATNGQLQNAQRQLQVLADTDPLTGCANRRVFRELVDQLRAGGTADRGCVLLVDMDGLKALNDQQGHAAGDAAIRRLADAIRTRTRMTDLVVRWGGDEFVVVLPGAALSDAQVRRDAFDAAITEEGLKASIGCASWQPGLDVMAAVQAADEDMYRVKSERKKRATA